MITEFGDLTKVKNSFICQQVNCMGIMGGGLALSLRKKYPETYEQYINFTKGKNADNILGEIQVLKTGDGNYVSNMFSQKYIVGYDESKVQTDYGALSKCLKHSMIKAQNLGFKEILVPHGLGSVLAGGDWLIVSSILLDLEKETGCGIKCVKLERRFDNDVSSNT